MVCVVGTGPARGWELLGGSRPTSQPMGHRKCIHSRDPQRRGPLLSLLLPACKVGCSGQRASPDRHTALLQPPMSLEPPCKALPTAWLQGQWLSDSWPEQGCMCPQKQQKLCCLLRHMLHCHAVSPHWYSGGKNADPTSPWRGQSCSWWEVAARPHQGLVHSSHRELSCLCLKSHNEL